MKEKRNILAIIEKEAPNLNNLLDSNQVAEFKELTKELRDTWTKKQVFRTRTEMEVSVLNDAKYPTNADQLVCQWGSGVAVEIQTAVEEYVGQFTIDMSTKLQFATVKNYVKHGWLCGSVLVLRVYFFSIAIFGDRLFRVVVLILCL